MKKLWNNILLGAKVGLIIEACALIAFLVLVAMGRTVPYFIINIFLLGMVLVILSNIYGRNRKK